MGLVYFEAQIEQQNDKDTEDLDDLESDNEDNESESKVADVAPAIAKSDGCSLYQNKNARSMSLYRKLNETAQSGDILEMAVRNLFEGVANVIAKTVDCVEG